MRRLNEFIWNTRREESLNAQKTMAKDFLELMRIYKFKNIS